MLLAARYPLRLPRLTARAFATRGPPRKPPPSKSSSIRQTPSIPQQSLPRPSNSPSKQTQNVPPPSNEHTEGTDAANAPSRVDAVSTALSTTPDSENNLITPVYMPEDPHAVLKQTHPAMKLLDNSSLIIQRQLELMNVLVGFEQANRYVIMDPHGNHIGYLAERDHGIGSTITRQMFKTHRSFTTHVFDKEEREVLRFHRPFAWISSRIRIYDAVGKDESAYTSSVALQGTTPGSVDTQTSARVSSLPLSEMRIIGSAEQEWAMLRRKYNLYLARNLEQASNAPQLASGNLPLSSSKELQVAQEGDPREVGMLQFARVDEPFLSWDFSLMSEDNRLIGSVNKNFAGFAREIFTDMGVYALRMDSAGLTTSAESLETIQDRAPQEHTGMTLDQRAVMLATAVSVDFDYFSRHSGGVGGVGMWPLWMPWGGEAAGGAAAGEAGAVGAAAGETGIASEVGAAARGVGVGEGAIAGAGTMAGYEAMRTGANRQQVDDQSPQAGRDDQSPFASDDQQAGQDVWGSGNDPSGGSGNDDLWGGGGNSEGQGGSGGDGGESGGGDGGGGFNFDDWF